MAQRRRAGFALAARRAIEYVRRPFAGDAAELMDRYSVFTLARHAFARHRNWPRAWRDPDPKPGYDIVVIGGGGHGLATAYYLAKNHGATSVAVLEKGYLGGGNTG